METYEFQAKSENGFIAAALPQDERLKVQPGRANEL